MRWLIKVQLQSVSGGFGDEAVDSRYPTSFWRGLNNKIGKKRGEKTGFQDPLVAPVQLDWRCLYPRCWKQTLEWKLSSLCRFARTHGLLRNAVSYTLSSFCDQHGTHKLLTTITVAIHPSFLTANLFKFHRGERRDRETPSPHAGPKYLEFREDWRATVQFHANRLVLLFLCWRSLPKGPIKMAIYLHENVLLQYVLFLKNIYFSSTPHRFNIADSCTQTAASEGWRRGKKWCFPSDGLHAFFDSNAPLDFLRLK